MIYRYHLGLGASSTFDAYGEEDRLNLKAFDDKTQPKSQLIDAVGEYLNTFVAEASENQVVIVATQPGRQQGVKPRPRTRTITQTWVVQYCNHYDRSYHTAEECFILHPESRRKIQGNDRGRCRTSHLKPKKMKVIRRGIWHSPQAMRIPPASTKLWIFDCVCTQRFTQDRAAFTSFIPYEIPPASQWSWWFDWSARVWGSQIRMGRNKSKKFLT